MDDTSCPPYIADLCCVECGSTRLEWDSAAVGDVVQCATCGVNYTAQEGILRMVPRASALRRSGSPAAEAPLDLNDALQADYWHDDSHAFRDAQHAIVRYFAEQRWRFLASKFDLATARTALDVGCGDGFSTLYAPRHLSVTACDGSLTMLRRHRGARRLQADAFQLPFQDGSFDLVFCWELLHHVSEPHVVLREMARVSRRWVVCCEPNPHNLAQFLFALADPAHRWVLRFSQAYMRRHAEEAGLVVHSFARGGCIFPNKTPAWLFPLLRKIPYRIPWVGISNCLIAELPRPAQSISEPDVVRHTPAAADRRRVA